MHELQIARDPITESPGLLRELLELIARQSTIVPAPVFLAQVIIATLAYEHAPWVLILFWLLLVTVVLALRYFTYNHSTWYGHLPDTSKLKVAISLSLLNGLAHGSSLIFFVMIPEFDRVIQSFLLIGLCSGAVLTTGGFFLIFLPYFFTTLVPLAVLWAISPGIELAGWKELSVAGIIILFGLVLIALARDAFRMFQESFEIRLREADLNRQLEEALAEAKGASKAKTRFLAIASHDLRQPVHNLLILSSALSMQNLDPRSAEIVDHIDVALGTLAGQLKALLDLSKLDAGVTEMRPGLSDASGLLRALKTQYEPQANEKGLVVTGEIPAQAMVVTDPALLERLLSNLIDNAIKYTDEGEIGIALNDRGDCYEIEISDSGRGIPDDELDSVFEEFYQIKTPDEERSKGLGLGLAIVKRLVKLLDVEQDVESTLGEGTRFSIKVSRAPVNQRDAPAATDGSPSVAGLKIIVIDDEPEIAIGMRILLEAMGCSPHTAHNTRDAVTLALADQPDLVIADLRLGGQDDGLQAIAEIRQAYPDTPALLVTGDTDPERLRDAQNANVVLLHKPVNGEDLLKAIATHLGRT